jgi:hypothetical protein
MPRQLAGPESRRIVSDVREQGEADAQRRQDYDTAHPEGVPVGTPGADPQPLTLPEDAAITGAHSVPGVQGGAR